MTARRVTFAPGDTIFSEGDPGTHCFQVVSGQVEIRLRRRGWSRAGDHQVVATLGPGDVFGEMSIIDDSPRSASAVAVEETICASYPADEVLELLTSDPDQALTLIKTLINRLRSANRKIARGG